MGEGGDVSVKTWSERCEEHPDHQEGMVTERMIQARMQEEIDELRAGYIRLQKALKWYTRWADNGDRARAALRKIGR